MKPSIVILPVLLALSGFSHAQNKTIYKCADTDYRDTPCATQQEHNAGLAYLESKLAE